MDGSIYVGEFRKGVMSGIGEIKYRNGEIYNGEMLNDLAHGQGELVDLNGDIYKGSFYNGQLHGEGYCRIEDIEGRCAYKNDELLEFESLEEYEQKKGI